MKFEFQINLLMRVTSKSLLSNCQLGTNYNILITVTYEYFPRSIYLNIKT